MSAVFTAVVRELETQRSILADRAAQLAGHLAAAKDTIAQLRAQLEGSKKDNGLEAAPD